MTNENSMSQLLDAYDVKTISRGDVIEGTVIDVNEKEVKVNINYAFDGVITRGELTKDEVNPLDVVKEGDKINVLVLSPNDGEGYVLLSRRRVVEKEERAKFNEELKKDKEKVSEAFKNGTNLTVEVKDEIKGGVA
ncbi:MAG: S1 RNA-binding domain-containing protein, partial [Clostridium sp.]